MARSFFWLTAASCSALAGCGAAEATPKLAPAQSRLASTCDAGDSAACHALGRALSNSHVEVALSAHEKACNAGRADACADLGLLYLSRNIRGARVTEQLGAGCARDIGRACRGLGDLKHLNKDVRGALKLYAKGCRHGDELACRHAGMFYYRGEGTLRDVGAALELLSLGCAGRSVEACFLLASVLQREESDPARVERLFRDGCSQGHSASCIRLAERAVDGTHGERSCQEATRLSTPACAQGNEEACAVQGQCEIQQARSAADGRARLHRACEADVVRACIVLGRALLEGTLSSPQPESGFPYLERGCRLDSPDACTHFAIQLLKRPASKKRHDSALEVLERACDEADVVAACVALSQEYQTGQHVLADAAQAARFRARACSLGQRELCRSAESASPAAAKPEAPQK